jgi:hypothetical protein
MAVKKPTKVQECGAWLMSVVQTLHNAVPVEFGRTKAIALPADEVNRLKKEAQEWAQVLGAPTEKGNAD